MATMIETVQGHVCNCDPIDGNTKTYYLWSCASNDKQKVTDVDEVYVTQDEVVFEKRSHETLRVPRDEVFMVTCEVCSAPPTW